MRYFVNLSNHPSAKWSKAQINEALKYGKIVDMKFPVVDPYCSEEEFNIMVEHFFDNIMKYVNPVVMLQGEFIFTFRLTTKLKKAGIKVIAGSSVRKTVEHVNSEGKIEKISIFEFAGFREY